MAATEDGAAEYPAGEMRRPALRCLLGMLGVDCHSKGIRTLARMLRDHGVEVIYLGEHNTAEAFAAAVVSEDPDVAGVSFSTATYKHHVGELLEALRSAQVEDVPVMIGGLIHPEDEAELVAMGVSAIFGPGSSLDAIMDYLNGLRRSSDLPHSASDAEIAK